MNLEELDSLILELNKDRANNLDLIAFYCKKRVQLLNLIWSKVEEKTKEDLK